MLVSLYNGSSWFGDLSDCETTKRTPISFLLLFTPLRIRKKTIKNPKTPADLTHCASAPPFSLMTQTVVRLASSRRTSLPPLSSDHCGEHVDGLLFHRLIQKFYEPDQWEYHRCDIKNRKQQAYLCVKE